MIIILHRKHLTDKWTLGELFVDGVFECFVCEDCVRPEGVKIKHETAIPEGRYRVKLAMSKRFKRTMPYLMDVPNFAGIIAGHAGNHAGHTSGCPLLGKRIDLKGGRVLDSVLAFNRYYPKVERAIRRGEEVWFTVTNEHIITDTRTSKAVH